MKNEKMFFQQIRIFLTVAITGILPANAIAGSLLTDIDAYLAGSHYPVATASLSLYDSNGAYIASQQMDAAGLLNAGFVNTGTEILFNGSLTFPNLYPFVAGGSGGAFATVRDFSVDLATASLSQYTDLVGVQIDWGTQGSNVSEEWGLVIGDDFENGIAYYMYGGYPPQALNYGSALFGLEFATGVVSAVPLPAAAWLMGSGLLGLLGVARRRRTSLAVPANRPVRVSGQVAKCRYTVRQFP